MNSNCTQENVWDECKGEPPLNLNVSLAFIYRGIPTSDEYIQQIYNKSIHKMLAEHKKSKGTK